jgi:hypothetical protein
MRETVLAEYADPARTMYLAAKEAVFTCLPYTSFDPVSGVGPGLCFA